MSIKKGPSWASFLRLFGDIARHRHRYEVFRDFVTMAAISLHNRVNQVDALEAEYLTIIGRYEKADVDRFPKLLAELVEILDGEPWDALGQLYMELGIQSEHVGQFFTPPEISELMARLVYGDALANLKEPFVTVQEPACGAGGMILAFTKVLIEAGNNPAEKMWAHCQDIDRTAALMCYLQLSLWNIPGVVVVGNTLAMESREVFYTPAHYLYRWDDRLAIRRATEAMRELIQTDANRPGDLTTADAHQATAVASPPATTIKPIATSLPGASGIPAQFDFGF
jgi:hypothetical protein